MKKKLCEIGEIIAGGTPSTKINEYWNGDISWITPKDLSNYKRRFISKGERSITKEGLKNSSAILIPKNSILFTSRAPIGYIAISEKELCTNQGFKSFVCNKEECYYKYMYYWFLNNVENIKAKANGSTFQEISGTVMKNIEIELPDMKTQINIGKILDTIDKKIELNNQANDNLLEIVKKIYKEWFIDFRFPSNNGNYINTDIGRIPEGWTIEKLEDVFFFQEGPGIRNWQYVEEEGTKFINIRCIKDDDLYLETANMISKEETVGKYNHFMLEEWDVVISTSGTLGKNQIIRKEHLPLCLNTSVIRFKPKKEFSNFSYMYNYLISNEFIDILNAMACGSVQKNFGPTHLKQIRLKYPSQDIINKFSEIVFPMIEKIQNNKSENIILKNLRDTLLPKLMNGEIGLENIEI